MPYSPSPERNINNILLKHNINSILLDNIPIFVHRLSKEFNHVHDLYRVVGIILTQELNKTVACEDKISKIAIFVKFDPMTSMRKDASPWCCMVTLSLGMCTLTTGPACTKSSHSNASFTWYVPLYYDLFFLVKENLFIEATNIDGGVLVPLRDWPCCHLCGCSRPLWKISFLSRKIFLIPNKSQPISTTGQWSSCYSGGLAGG